MNRQDAKRLAKKRADLQLSRMLTRQRHEEARARAEEQAVAEFVPTPRPTVLARAVQRVLGPPPVDDPSHGRRELLIQRTREGLGLEETTPNPDGARADRNA